MTRAGSGSAKRSDSGQGNIKNFFAKKAEAPESMEVAATGDTEAKAKSPGHSPGKTSDYESEVGVPENVVWSFDSNFDLCFLFSRSAQPSGSSPFSSSQSASGLMNVRQRQVPSSPGRYMTNISETNSLQRPQVVHMKSIKTKKEYALSDEETIPLKNQ